MHGYFLRDTQLGGRRGQQQQGYLGCINHTAVLQKHLKVWICVVRRAWRSWLAPKSSSLSVDRLRVWAVIVISGASDEFCLCANRGSGGKSTKWRRGSQQHLIARQNNKWGCPLIEGQLCSCLTEVSWHQLDQKENMSSSVVNSVIPPQKYKQKIHKLHLATDAPLSWNPMLRWGARTRFVFLQWGKNSCVSWVRPVWPHTRHCLLLWTHTYTLLIFHQSHQMA